ncbi:unnamed protein product [Blepharisma stoltei]|uniref:C2H2-type domain-containing protein n=1 Tax=Blepharisma stoltei TaxID=1481888 RepID=A0AAU9K1Y7_9CILI|nr:unnamed protein product [Blepharisma stoltei]
MFKEALLEFPNASKSLPSVVCLSLAYNSRPKISLQCKDCNLVFRSQKDLCMHRYFTPQNEHLKPQRKLNADQAATNDSSSLEPFFCEECKIAFKSRKGKMQHLGKIHKTKYKHSRCQICNKKFRNKYAVRFHVKQVHEKSTRVKCMVCEKEFYNKYLLVDHMEKCQI